MHRRDFLAGTAGMAALVAWGAPSRAARDGSSFAVTRTPEEWRAMLGDAAYEVMREMGTERPFSSPLNAVKAEGTFHCKGCDQALYSSETKFESGTGWPSFWAPIEGAIGTKPDRGFFAVRTEVHCSRCGSHMGHVFEDGPEPTGLRYCMNGVAMVFRPEGSGEPVVG